MPIVSTIQGKCKRCYNCVRNCPAKAIRIKEGQAEVIEERCIACVNIYGIDLYRGFTFLV
jgi:ferredoxin